jgi:dihydroorotase
VHICHASTEGTVELLTWARGQGIAITAEVTPHHLLLDDTRLHTYDPVNKVNPPLREDRDRQALRRALADGIVDCVATDHAPHAAQDKCCEFANARPGMLGLQTALSIVVETMVRPGLIDWRGVAKVMSERPAQITGLPDQGRPIAVGEPANLALIDPDTEWTVESGSLASLSENSPFDGMTLPAVVVATVLRGGVTNNGGKVRSPR